MAQRIETFEFSDNFNDFEHVEKYLLKKWTDLSTIPNIFRYELSVEKQKILNGDYRFLVQLNKDRTALRRKPQVIASITPAFDENAFNFTKVKSNEYLFNVVLKQKGITVSFLINQSPLTPYHSLICPNLMDKKPQILTLDSIEIAVQLLLGFGDRKYRIGYNSPGALASVNHLHMHLIVIEEQLCIEKAVLKHLTKNIYVLDDKYPAKGYCFPLFDKTQINDVANDVFVLIEFLNKCQKAHNVFFTFAASHDNDIATTTPTSTIMSTTKCLTSTESDGNILKIFVFPRDICCMNKEICNFNVAFCEICGYLPVGDETVYNTITEDFIISEIESALGDVVNHQFNAEIMKLYSANK